MLPERVSLDDFNTIPREPSVSNGSGWIVLGQVEMKPIRFVDKPLWQAGAFHLLVGEKGCGKGTYLAHLAAAFTRGEFGDKRTVLWIAAGEDSLAIDVRPRVEAAGGNPDLIASPKERLLLPGCVEELRFMAASLGDVGLILFDPIAGLFDGKHSTNYDADIRAMIDPINQLADEHDLLAIGVRHLGKDRSRGALHSIMGGLDWVNVPRAVIGIGVDEGEVRHIQVMVGNRAPGSVGRTFVIEGAPIQDFPEPVTRATFTGASTKEVGDLLEAVKVTSRTREAMDLMLNVLEAEGEQESDTLSARVAQETGLAIKTVKNAKTILKDEGLLAFRPGEKNDDDKVLKWLVYRTLAPRLGTPAGTPPDEGVLSAPGTAKDTSRDTPAGTPPVPDGTPSRARSTGLNLETQTMERPGKDAPRAHTEASYAAEESARPDFAFGDRDVEQKPEDPARGLLERNRKDTDPYPDIPF